MVFSVGVQRSRYSLLFGTILQRILQELAEYGGGRLSWKYFLGFMSVTILKYHKEKCICHWYERSTDVTDATSGLMSFFIHF